MHYFTDRELYLVPITLLRKGLNLLSQLLERQAGFKLGSGVFLTHSSLQTNH